MDCSFGMNTPEPWCSSSGFLQLVELRRRCAALDARDGKHEETETVSTETGRRTAGKMQCARSKVVLPEIGSNNAAAVNLIELDQANLDPL
jgi:hypothetical protein